MNDLRALWWLRWTQFRDSATYWLRTLGYQPPEPGERGFGGNLYVLYLIGIAVIWFYTMFSFAFQQMEAIGAALDPDGVAALLDVIPWLSVIALALALSAALRSTPLKLSFADMAYIAGSPVARWAPVLFGFIRQVLLRLLIGLFIVSLISVAIASALELPDPVSAVLRGLISAVPLIILIWSVAWVLGVLRLVYPQLSRIPLLWVLPLVLIPLAIVLPDVFLWPGRGVVAGITGEQPLWYLPLLSLAAAGAIGLFLRASSRINMIQAIDESITYARISAMGLMAIRHLRVVLQIQRQAASAARKPRLQLAQAQGFNMLALRAALSYARHPLLLVIAFLWGAAMTWLAALILINQLPAQIWIGWLLLAAIAPPAGLLHVLSDDLEEPFLRQFLPMNNLTLFLADTLAPLLALISGGLLVWVAHGFSLDVSMLGLLFIPVLAGLLGLCGAVSLTQKRPLQTRILATALSFGAAMAAGALTGIPLAAFVVAWLGILVLSGVLAAET